MYKNILCVITSCEHNILKILKKQGYKIDTISSKIPFKELKNLIYKKNYEIFLTSGCVERKKLAQIHQFMFKNFPQMLFINIIYDIKQSCTVQTCVLLKQNMCESICIPYSNKETFTKILEQITKKHSSILYGKLLISILDIIKKVVTKYEKFLSIKKEFQITRNDILKSINNFIKSTFEIITDKLVSLFLADKISIFLYNNLSEKYELISSYGFDLTLESEPIIIKDNWKVINYAISKKKCLLLQNGLHKYSEFRKKNVKTNQKISSSIILPLTFGKTVLGVICMSRLFPNKRLFLNQEFVLAKQFAHWLSYIYSIIISHKMALEYERMKLDFVSIINHEIRTPIMAISAATELIEKNLPPKIYSLITRNIQKLNFLVDQLLDFSKISRGIFSITKTKNSISELVREIISEYSWTLKDKNIQLQTTFDLKNDLQYFDKERLKQVIANLINNSLKFIHQKKSNKLIKLSIGETKKSIVFCVADNGIGIPSKDLKNIFNPFVQLSETNTKEKSGVGLGLAIAKSIIESHGGEIWAESVIGEWTKIYFTIPKKF